jgi:hypothetical protein
MYVIGTCVAVALVALAAYTLAARRRLELRAARDGQLWKRAYHLGSELASGRNVERNTADLRDMIASRDRALVVATAVAVAVRQQPDDVDAALYRAVNRSALPSQLSAQLETRDVNRRIEVLELAEVLRLHDLFAAAAVMTRDDDPGVVRAACDALVALDPASGLGVLIGLAGKHESWIIDSLGRAAHRIGTSGNGAIPLGREKWRNVPLLAQRAINESATFDAATVADAVSVLIGSLDNVSASVRLAAVNALAGSVESHPQAQLALAAALGSTDRMVRFATAAALSDTVIGQSILRSAAAGGDGSDAARIAAEILWTRDPLSRPAGAVAS